MFKCWCTCCWTLAKRVWIQLGLTENLHLRPSKLVGQSQAQHKKEVKIGKKEEEEVNLASYTSFAVRNTTFSSHRATTLFSEKERETTGVWVMKVQDVNEEIKK